MKTHSQIKMLIIALVLISGGIMTAIQIQAEAENFRVFRIFPNGTLSDVLLETTDYQLAAAKMKAEADITPNVIIVGSLSRSPLKIVAADRALVQSYPFRKGEFGSASGAANTLSIFSNATLTSKITYLGPHYKLYYHETQAVGSNFAVKVTFEGVTGYADLRKVDIIPLIFIEQGFMMTLGGHEDYYLKQTGTPEAEYVMRIKPDYFQVTYNQSAKTNYLTHVSTRSWYTSGTSTLNYGIAPDWLPVGMYYSLNGINFYADFTLTQPVYDGDKIGAYYNYFQWLPLRTFAGYTGQQYNDILVARGKTDSILYGKAANGEYKSQPFYEQGQIYRMNSLLFFAQSALESAYGTSSYAKNRFNLFGWNAYDSSPNSAAYYAGITEVVQTHMSANMMGYVNKDDWRFGTSFGNKGSGVAMQYASDPYYGIKVSDLAFSMDRSLGHAELNKYYLAKLNDDTVINIRKEASTTSAILYTTKSKLINQIVALFTLEKFGPANDFYQIITPVSNKNTTAEVGYVHESLLTILDQTNPGGVSVDQTADGSFTQNFILAATLNLRSAPSTAGTALTQIPSNTVISGELTNNGWIKTTYGGKTGYVSYEYANIYHSTIIEIPTETPTEPVEPIEPEEPELLDPSETALFELLNVSLTKGIITGLPLNQPVEQLINTVLATFSELEVTIKSADGQIKLPTEVILTGDQLFIESAEEFSKQYQIAIIGDVNGDGKISAIDYARIANHILGRKVVTGYELEAMDLNRDGNVSAVDYARLANHILGRKLLYE